MNKPELFNEGFQAFKPELDVYQSSPYKGLVHFRHDVISFQVESVPFFNGWEMARKTHDKAPIYGLFLDDFRFPNWVSWIALPNVHWVIARHGYDFINIIEKYGMPAFVSWDYDLDLHGLDDVKDKPYLTGLDCVEWLIKHCETNKLPFPSSAVHSMNPQMGPKIYARLKEYLDSKKPNAT